MHRVGLCRVGVGWTMARLTYVGIDVYRARARCT